MNEPARDNLLFVPGPDEAQHAVDEARRVFQRILPIWACDLLALRRAGLDRPAWTGASDDASWQEAA